MGIGGGMFAAPNTASIMNSVPPEHRGAASGMRATLQNTGQTVSLAVFFTVDNHRAVEQPAERPLEPR